MWLDGVAVMSLSDVVKPAQRLKRCIVLTIGEHMKLAGIILIVLGVAALIYGGFSYTNKKKAVDMGPVQIEKTEHHTIPIPPLLGVVAILGGGVLIYFGVKQNR
jgi:uncharacterized membrane protein YidH (DUF202 family)